MRRLVRCPARFLRDVAGVSAVEFAVLMPVFTALMFGGYAMMTTVALSRKVTIATHSIADLTSQYSSITQAQMDTILAASTQILAPYDASPLSIRISEITTNPGNSAKATVTWSTTSGSGFTAYKVGKKFTLPTTMPRSTSQSFLYAETTYAYTPPFGTTLVGTISLGDQIFMLPRLSTSVAYPGS